MEEIQKTLDAIKNPTQQLGVGFSNLRTALKEADLDGSGRIDTMDEFYHLIQRSPSVLGYIVSILASGYMIYGAIKRIMGEEFDIMSLIIVGIILIAGVIFTAYIKKISGAQNNLVDGIVKFYKDKIDNKNDVIEKLQVIQDDLKTENMQLKAILTVKDSAVKAYQTKYKDIPVPNVAESEYFPKIPKKRIPIKDANGKLLAYFEDGEITLLLQGGLKSTETKETQSLE